MNPTWPEVNAAVLAVLGDFLGGGRNNGRPRAAAPSRNGHPRRSDEATGLIFADRLLSLRHAERLAADSAREVRVAAGTVVTPLARDWLKRSGVSIKLVSGRELAGARAVAIGEWGFAITTRAGLAEPLRRALLDGRDWSEVGSDELDAAEWVVAGEGRGAVVVADEASVACWRANRVDGVRAATVGDVDAVARAVRHLGANLVVAEPAGLSIHALRQVAERFRRGGAPTLPDGWDEETNPTGWEGQR